MSAYCYEVWLERPGQPKERVASGLLDGIQAMRGAIELMSTQELAGCSAWVEVKNLIPMTASLSPKASEKIAETMVKARADAAKTAYKLRVVPND